MNAWALVPVPAILALLAGAILASSRRGAPRGRATFALAGTSGAVLLVSLALVLAGAGPAAGPWAGFAGNLSLLALIPLWVALCQRLGRNAPFAGAAWRLLPFTLLAGLALVIAGAFAPGASEIRGSGSGTTLLLRSTAARGAAGVFLLIGAFGVLRFQALAEAARREQRGHLRHAASGMIIASLGIFLFASQTLLYGAISLPVLALASLALVPATIAAWPAWRSTDEDAVTLPPGSRPVHASAVLLSLGAFLIALAALGELFERYAPQGRQIWFQWGSPILLGTLASLWFVPGFRRRLRRSFRVPQLADEYRWDHASLLRHASPHGASAAVAQVAGWVEEVSSGRPRVAIWVRDEGGASFVPWSGDHPPLPVLPAANPLTAALSGEWPVVDLVEPPERLSLVPAYVENLDLVEGRGYRLFVALRSGGATFALLGLALRHRQSDATTALAMELLAGEIAVLVWGSLIAATDLRQAPQAGDARFYQEAAALVRRAGMAAAGRPYLPRLAAALALASEEVAAQLQARALESQRREADPGARARAERAVGP